jgi:RND family efflux transporter MFP subunit
MVKKCFFCVLILSFALLCIGCSEKIEPGNVEQVKKKAVKAPIAVAAIIRQPFMYEAVGTVKAKTISTLSSKIMGTVTFVFVQGGDTVEQGQQLVAIDDRQVLAQLREAEAALAEARRGKTAAKAARDAAKAGAELAGATYNRYLNLMKDASASLQEFDEIKSRYYQAQATLKKADAMFAAAKQRVNQAEATVSVALVRKKDALILAPFNGKISAKMIDVGDLATPGKPLLILEKKGEYHANLELPETYIEDVTQGKRVNVVVQALNTGPMTGWVEEVFPAADEKSRSFLIKVKLPDEKGLRTGMFARIFIPVDKVDILLIPSTAVIHSGQLTGIYIVDDQHTARFRLIRTGRVFGESLEVLSGLKEGDRYVVVPPPTLSNGTRVEVIS